jgi:hypothetical protein
MRISYFISLIIVFLLSISCEPSSIDKVPPASLFCFINQSNYTITVTGDIKGGLINNKFKVEPGQKIEIQSQLSEFFRYKCLVYFDLSVTIDYKDIDRSVQFNITNPNNYSLKLLANDDIGAIYTYNFTDDDYQYALENGTILEF